MGMVTVTMSDHERGEIMAVRDDSRLHARIRRAMQRMRSSGRWAEADALFARWWLWAERAGRYQPCQ